MSRPNPIIQVAGTDGILAANTILYKAGYVVTGWPDLTNVNAAIRGSRSHFDSRRFLFIGPDGQIGYDAVMHPNATLCNSPEHMVRYLKKS